MEFTPWSAFVDLGLISVLLLIGVMIRSKVKFVQKLFLPAGIIAGILGLIFGPNGVNFLPFSSNIDVYSGVLITIVFGLLPFSDQKIPWKEIKQRVGGFWAYGQSAMLLQWGLGILFTALVLKFIFSDLNPGFGAILAAGFVGGHGTAAAIGPAFVEYGWEDATSLAMTSATVGVLTAILGGLFLIKRGSETGKTSFISSFKELPNDLRSGLITRENQNTIGRETMSSISVDSVVFHLALASIIGAGGYALSEWGSNLIGGVSIPAFSVAFIVGLVIKKVIEVTKTGDYVDHKTLKHISGGATDLLVSFGIASISLRVVSNYMYPLILLLTFGILFCFIVFKLAPMFFEKWSFERAIFEWGVLTGTFAMGIALLRIVDPEQRSKTLDDAAITYIPSAPVEILVVTFTPVLLMTGQSWILMSILIGAGILVLIASKFLGFYPSRYSKDFAKRS